MSTTQNQDLDEQLPVASVEEDIQILIKKYGKEIFLQDFTMPNGDVADFLLMRTRKNMHSCMILAITDDSNVIVQREFRHAVNRVILEIPGGCAEPGESPEEAIVRELKEESGYIVGELINLGIHLPDPAFMRVEHNFYLGTGCQKVSDAIAETSGFIETQVFELDEWVNMCLNGVVTDGKSVAITMRALPHLGYSLSRE